MSLSRAKEPPLIGVQTVHVMKLYWNRVVVHFIFIYYDSVAVVSGVASFFANRDFKHSHITRLQEFLLAHQSAWRTDYRELGHRRSVTIKTGGTTREVKSGGTNCEN